MLNAAAHFHTVCQLIKVTGEEKHWRTVFSVQIAPCILETESCVLQASAAVLDDHTEDTDFKGSTHKPSAKSPLHNTNI